MKIFKLTWCIYYKQWVVFVIHTETNPHTRIASKYINSWTVVCGLICWGNQQLQQLFILSQKKSVWKRKKSTSINSLSHNLDASFSEHFQWFSYGKDCVQCYFLLCNLISVHFVITYKINNTKQKHFPTIWFNF